MFVPYLAQAIVYTMCLVNSICFLYAIVLASFTLGIMCMVFCHRDIKCTFTVHSDINKISGKIILRVKFPRFLLKQNRMRDKNIVCGLGFYLVFIFLI